MRSCTPIFVGTAPRESVFKSAPHSAAPVGKPSQTRRHHLTPTPGARRATAPERVKSVLFFWTVHGPFSFPQDGKENGGCIPLDKPPCGSRDPVAAVRRPVSP